jgi:hypothetical protein
MGCHSVPFLSVIDGELVSQDKYRTEYFEPFLMRTPSITYLKLSQWLRKQSHEIKSMLHSRT